LRARSIAGMGLQSLHRVPAVAVCGPIASFTRCGFVIGPYFRQETPFIPGFISAGQDGRRGQGAGEQRDNNVIEIVILAMIAAFLGLRLYSVLGRRAEHEEEPVPTRFERPDGAAAPRPLAPQAAELPRGSRDLSGLAPHVEQGLRQISAADRRFDLAQFTAGARAAYGMVLEAFWRGDKEELRSLCDDDVYASFAGAIDARVANGEVLDNRLVRIEDVEVQGASLDGRTARIAVLFVADIAAVTRDKDGHVIAGSLVDAIEARDVWTFSRDVSSADPDWLLDETDEG